MSKLVFISGPYSGPNREANITSAIEAALWCAEHRIFYFCPHMNSAYMDTLAPDVPTSFYYAMDEEILSRCDAILVLPGWGKSKGATAEVSYCLEHKMPIFLYPDEQDRLLNWQREETA